MVRVVKDPQQRKEEIIIAAGELFMAKGYDKTTMKDVMNALGIAKGTIYHYFQSKDDLLQEVIKHIVQAKLYTQKRRIKETKGNALEKIEQLVVAGSHKEDEIHELIEHLHKPANAGMHIRLIAHLITMLAPLYEELICQGCEEGVFATDAPLECAEFMLSAMQFLTDIGVYPWTQEELSRRAIAFPGLIESLLNAPKGSFHFLLELNH